MNKQHIVVFSGGSAANNLVDVFGKVAEDKGCSLSYIIPISDNGGSSSELIRVFGGPGIGDVRSRLVRLIPEDPSIPETTAIKTLFNHRLSSDSSLARIEWLDIVEGRHTLWTSVSSEKRELIRSFLNTINLEIVKRLRPSSSFNFQSASVGNLFLTGARLFTGSFESAIYLLGAITGVPNNVNVIPAINSNFSYHISAGLENGDIITGQNSISHPSAPSAPAPIPTPLPRSENSSTLTLNHLTTKTPSLQPSSSNSSQNVAEETPLSPTTTHLQNLHKELTFHESIEDANLPGSLPTLRKQYITYAKTHTEDLPSRIRRIWYINPYGQEIHPSANPKALACLERAKAVIYSIGSLYTSLVPCLVLRDVGRVIAEGGGARFKILVLNGCLDRETRSLDGGGFTALDFVRAVADACVSSSSKPSLSLSSTQTHTTSTHSPHPTQQTPKASPNQYKNYITHVIHLQGEGTPKVEKDELAKLGIECVRIYGRKKNGAGGDGDGDGGMIYDGAALGQALEAIIGGPGLKGGIDRSRRNTLGVGV